jgi:hypothetical protein
MHIISCIIEKEFTSQLANGQATVPATDSTPAKVGVLTSPSVDVIFSKEIMEISSQCVVALQLKVRWAEIWLGPTLHFGIR